MRKLVKLMPVVGAGVMFYVAYLLLPKLFHSGSKVVDIAQLVCIAVLGGVALLMIAGGFMMSKADRELSPTRRGNHAGAGAMSAGSFASGVQQSFTKADTGSTQTVNTPAKARAEGDKVIVDTHRELRLRLWNLLTPAEQTRLLMSHDVNGNDNGAQQK